MAPEKWVSVWVLALFPWLALAQAPPARHGRQSFGASGVVLAHALGGTELTIYNQNFAVARTTLRLDLRAGTNQVQFAGATGLLAPGSVILRAAQGTAAWRILQQNYRADPVSQDRLLRWFQGRTIHFLVDKGGAGRIIAGTIVRAGWQPPPPRGYSYPPPPPPLAPETGVARQPLIEVNGALRFGLPGQPLFPALPPGTILTPVLNWQIASPAAGRATAELSYLTGGLTWSARYNAVQAAGGGPLAIYGWDMVRNWSGHTFRNARVQLMAGEVRYAPPGQSGVQVQVGAVIGGLVGGGVGRPLVSQRPLDVYHLYTVRRAVTLRDGESKEIEFLHAAAVQSRRYFVYDGLRLRANNYRGWDLQMVRDNRGFGTGVTHQVEVVRAFANTPADGLGVPLPAGRLRFYRQDAQGRLQFLGEDQIANTAAGQTVRATTGAAFDLWGNRTQTDYQIDQSQHTANESFRITLRNQRTEAAEIRVIEHLYRGNTWTITQHSDLYAKRDSHTIEFRVTVPARGQKIITYTVHYSW